MSRDCRDSELLRQEPVARPRFAMTFPLRDFVRSRQKPIEQRPRLVPPRGLLGTGEFSYPVRQTQRGFLRCFLRK